MIPQSSIDVDADDAVAEALARFGGFIRNSARSLARDNTELARDLEQEAGIMLWRLDPTRFDSDDTEYVRTVVYRRMHKMARAERRARGGNRRVDLDL